MESSKVVLRYRDGRTERVSIAPIDAASEAFVVTRDDGATADVPFATVKAVFFPRPAAEDPVDEPSGSTLAVEFADGEVIRGLAHYNPERKGFFLYPTDRSKNERIFVVSSAIVSIEVERL